MILSGFVFYQFQPLIIRHLRGMVLELRNRTPPAKPDMRNGPIPCLSLCNSAHSGLIRRSSPFRTTSPWVLKRAGGLVGATGIEPARIAPKDPKSFASANSATRPDSRSILAPADTIVNSFPARRAAACRQQATAAAEGLRHVPHAEEPGVPACIDVLGVRGRRGSEEPAQIAPRPPEHRGKLQLVIFVR